MGLKLFYQDKPLFGLEISQTGLHAVAIKGSHVIGYGGVDLDPVEFGKSIDSKSDYLTKSIKSMLESKIIGKLPSNRVAISVPTAKAFSRSLTLPIDAEENLLEALQLESEQYIPVAPSDLYMDHRIIKRKRDTIDVLMCAVPKRLVNAMIKASTNAGLEVVLVEPAILSLARVIGHTEDGGLPTVIVDISAASSDIAILDTSIRVTGSAPVGGHTLTLSISKKLDVSLKEAHKLKVTKGLSNTARRSDLYNAVKSDLDNISNEIRKVLRYYNERIGSPTKIEQVVILGSGSNIPGISDYFTEALMLPARSGSPWHKLDFDGLTQPSQSIKPRYVTSVGLAMVKPEDIWA